MTAAPRSLCVVVHDVAPSTWSACQRLLDDLARIGDIPTTLLAVPRYHGAARTSGFERWLCRRADYGDEVALHGYTHLDTGTPHGWLDWLRRRHYTRGEGEFWDLTYDEAALRLRAGLRWLGDIGLTPSGFVAPAWLLGEDGWRAVREQRFVYTCTLREIHLLREQRSLTCQAQVYSTSSAWRRGASVLWNESLAWRQRAQPVVRVELHPGDADHAGVRRSWQRLVQVQLQSREACTLLSLVARIRTGSSPPAP